MTTLFSVFLFVMIASVCVVVIIDNKNPVNTAAWLIVIIFIPIVGLMLYLLLGRNYKKNKLYQRLLEENALPEMRQVAYTGKSELSPQSINIAQFIYRSCLQPLSYNNKTDFYFQGEPWLKQMLEDIGRATHHLHLEFFIWRPDEIGKLLRDALLEKAEQGVKVRILLDRMGSNQVAYLKRAFLQPIVEHKNVCFGWFYPTRVPFIQTKINYRNHRKIVVIDGQVAYSGGMNIGNEYVNGGKFAHWRDAQFRMTGEAAYSFQMIFLMDWYMASKEYLFKEEVYFPEVKGEGKRSAQVVPSGPDQKWETIAQAYFRLINEAKEELLISTPYLIPDEAILMSLKTAALRGVEVKILIPGNPDHHIVYWASSSYFYELLRAGVKIYTYQKGFLHSKMVICDNLVASVGSANLDLRSLYTNFEVNALWYSREDIVVLRTQFYRDIRYSQQVTMKEVLEQSAWVRFRNSVARLFSPLI